MRCWLLARWRLLLTGIAAHPATNRPASGRRALDWPDCGGLAKRGISLDIRNAPANTAIEKHFEYLRPVRFIYALQGSLRLARTLIFGVSLPQSADKQALLLPN